MQLNIIQNKIFEIRGQRVMLDFDLAELYEVETKAFNQAVKRNVDSFPDEFMFRLSKEEWMSLKPEIVLQRSQGVDNQLVQRSQIVTLSSEHVDNQLIQRSQFVILNKIKGTRYLPYAFTEHGVTMAASVLKSAKARKMNIAIVRAFIAMRKMLIQYAEVVKVIDDLKERIDGHDAQLNQIYDALENMLDKKVEEENSLKEWQERERMGFKNK